MRIVCGTDFSECAAVAVRAAAAIATRAAASLELVHVASATEPSAKASAATLARLEAAAEPLRADGLTVTTRLLDGRPDEALVQHAAGSAAALVVIGALGERSGSRWFVGSTAERVAQATRVPVLVIRSAEPFEAWARESRPLRVLVGADLSASADAAVRWSQELAGFGPCSATIVHVYWPPEEHARLGIKGSMSMVDKHPDVARVLSRELASRLEAAGHSGLEIRVELSFGRVGDALAMLALRETTDLVVVGTRQRYGIARLWHGSVSSAVLDAATTAVACVPLAEQEEDERPVSVPKLPAVLSTTDLSDLANRAVGHAYAAVDDGGLVHLLHVQEIRDTTLPNPLYAHYAPTRVPAPEERRRAHDELAARLTALEPPEAKARGIRTEVHVIEATDVVAAIEATAERLGASLICIGSHGRSRLVSALLGSVAQGVVAASRRPVLVVPVSGR